MSLFKLYFTNTASDLTLGGAFTDKLSTSSGSGTVSITATNSGGTNSGYFVVDAGSTYYSEGGTRTYTGVINVSTAASNTTFAVRFHRVNSSGTIQTSTNYSGELSAGATGDNSVASIGDLGTWASTDRIAIEIRVTNNNAHGGAAGPTFNNAATNAVITPAIFPSFLGNVDSYTDTFTRSVTGDIGGDWNLYSNLSNTYSVNGSALQITRGGTATESAILSYILNSSGGYEFFIRAQINQATTFVERVNLVLNAVLDSASTTTNPSFGIDFDSSTVSAMRPTRAGSTITYSLNTNYSIRIQTQRVSNSKYLYQSKIWLSSNSEPSTWDSPTEVSGVSSYSGYTRFDFSVTDSGSIITIDEVSIKGIGGPTAFAQAQTKIGGGATTTNAFAQGQADILATSSKYAQAQADIKTTSNKFAQAQVDIKVTSNVFAQAQVRLVVTSNQFSQAQADIKTTVNVFAQSTVDIKNTSTIYSSPYAQAQADIKQTYPIVGIITSGWNFDVNVDGPNLGQNYFNTQSLGSFNHNGGIVNITINWTLFDNYEFFSADASIITSFTTIHYPNSTFSGTVSAGTYSVTARVDGTDSLNDVDPAHVRATGHVDVSYSGSVATPSADPYAQAQADIRVTQNQLAQAQTRILTTYKQFAQSQSDIKAVSTLYAQVQADIEATTSVFAQAQAQIKTIIITNAFAQSQADILVTSKVFSNAQSDIKVTSVVFSQAQADIKVTSVVFAQVNTSIRVVNSQFAQGQAGIKSTTNIFAQSQADIKATTNQFAQSQADIKVTNARYAQAQSDIKAVSNQFAQAQTDIVTSIQVFAQAQTGIKAIITVYGQAQADILATGQAFAQSSADIKVTNNSYAQAQVLIYIAQNLKPIADITTNSWVGVVV